jgi:outer membrane receptor protein involved in Fe transport
MTTPSLPCTAGLAGRLVLLGALTSATLGLTLLSRAQPTTPAASSQTAENEKKEIVTLSIFEVTDKKDEGYRSTQTLSGSRTLESLRDTPNSISVINRELINDLNATTVAELSMFSITGEVGTNSETPIDAGGYVFRGITANIQLRNGIYWTQPMDTYNIDRVELLRGPTAFLYGEGSAGGLMNQLTKTADQRDAQKLNLISGSYRLRRAEFDLNRRVNDKLAVRMAVVKHASDGFQHHVDREFFAAYFTANYRPFKNTNINVNMEYGNNNTTMGYNMIAENFSTTERTGATTAYSATVGGYTVVPKTGAIFSSVNLRYTTGTNIVLSDESILPRKLNLSGPDAYQHQYYRAFNASIDQRVFTNLNLQASGTLQSANREVRTKGGSFQAQVRMDANRTLPDGSVNPYYNQHYTEFYHRKLVHDEPMQNMRLTAVYDLKLKFMTQRILASGVYHQSIPNNKTYSEFVDPATSFFTGTLTNASTLAAYQANNTTMSRNYFYRRFYLKDGDAAELTKGGVVPGRSVMMRDAVADGATGRLTARKYWTPGYGIGSSGSYFRGRIHTMVGWRRDSFNQNPDRDFYNMVSGETYVLSSTVPVITRISEDSINYGGVVRFFDFVSGYYNFADAVALSSGIGGNGLVPGTVRGPSIGDGAEYGLRWVFFGGRLESNWTGYVTNAKRVAANPAVTAAITQTELGALFTDINPGGADTQATKASGLEFETVANLTSSWRLTWNYATNKLATSNRYPQLKAFQARAKAQNSPTPLTDAFLAAVPDGTPLPGFTKTRSNLVTNYRFAGGPLKGLLIGGGGQYREKSYQGNFDLNRDGVAEQLWTPGYILWNVMLGYRAKILERKVDFSANINNIADKSYFRSYSLSAGGWGEGRNFRVSARIDL